jgi:DnaJ-class molecular chaperone
MQPNTCPVCGGSGETGSQFQLFDGSIDDDIQPCELCGGSGEVTDEQLAEWESQRHTEVLAENMCVYSLRTPSVQTRGNQ